MQKFTASSVSSREAHGFHAYPRSLQTPFGMGKPSVGWLQIEDESHLASKNFSLEERAEEEKAK